MTAVYGRDGKKLRGFAYRNHIMVEHNQPDGLVSRYEYDRYDAKTNLFWTSAEPKRTHFVWDGSRLLQEYTYKGSDEPLAQVFRNNQDEA